MKTSRALNRVTLPRAISKLGYASRTQAFVFIEEGSVEVNGKTERNPHRWIDLRLDKISVNSETVSQKEFRYLLFHKPVGVATTHSDERGNATVFDLLGETAEGLSPVGRLDKDTSGLLLLTNDHQLAHSLTDPAIGVDKTYHVTLDRPLINDDARRLEEGVTIRVDGANYHTKRSVVTVRGPSRIEVTIREGKNRQIRKMFQTLGYTVIELQRVIVGSLSLGSLREKETRKLSKAEVEALRSVVRK
jgi:23S rRNA pseudouridine2605 synthase